MATSKRLPMPEMGKVQNQTTFRQLDNIRAAKVDGEIPRNAGAFAEGFESLAKLGMVHAGQQKQERDEAAEKAKVEDQKLQALVLQTDTETSLTEFQNRIAANPDKIDDDDWVSSQVEDLLENKALSRVTDEFLREKGTVVFQGGVERMVGETRLKAAESRKVGIVSDALIRVTEDFNGAIANNPSGKDALVATGKATLEHLINGLGMTKDKAIPLLVAIAKKNATEGKHSTFLASVLKDDPDLPAEIRMQMETLEAQGMAQTAVDRELAKTDLFIKEKPSIDNGSYTAARGRKWVEQGIISADTNMSWDRQAQSNREKALREAKERAEAAQKFSATSAAGGSVEGFLRLTNKEQDAVKAMWEQSAKRQYGDKWVGPYLNQLRMSGARDDDIQNLSKATAKDLVGLVSNAAEVPGSVQAFLSNPKVQAAFQSGDLARHMDVDVATRLLPMLYRFNNLGPDIQGQHKSKSPEERQTLLVDSFNLASRQAMAPLKNDVQEEAKKIMGKALPTPSKLDPRNWGLPDQTNTGAWKEIETYAGRMYAARLAKGVPEAQAREQTITEVKSMYVSGRKGPVPTQLATLPGMSADAVSDIIDTQVKELARTTNRKPGEFSYEYTNGKLFFLQNGMYVHNATLSANAFRPQVGTAFVRESARKEIKK